MYVPMIYKLFFNEADKALKERGNEMKISIVIPCYNEGKKLYKNIKKTCEYLISLGHEFEIIVSNDGSKDNTVDEVKRIQQEFANVILVGDGINRGKGYAVRSGMLQSTGDIVYFMDADLSTDLKAIEDTLSHFNNNHIVIGTRKTKEANIVERQPIKRFILGRMSVKVINCIIPLNLTDTQCGFKGFRREVVDNVFSKQTIDGFAFDVEVLYISKLLGYSIKEIPVTWENDVNSTVKVFRDSYRFFKALFEIRSKKKIYQS